MGCPCHIFHNTALKASASFLEVGAIVQDSSIIIMIAYYNYLLITILMLLGSLHDRVPSMNNNLLWLHRVLPTSLNIFMSQWLMNTVILIALAITTAV